MYTKESKYNGENNNFTFKLAIFNDICSKANLFFEAYMKAFLTMLKDLTLDYDYSNIGITSLTMDFNQVYYLIQAYFENVKYKKNILFKWNSITLQLTMTRNKGKSMKKLL